MENNKSSFTLALQEAFSKIVQMRAAGLQVTKYTLAIRLFPAAYTTDHSVSESFERLISLQSLALIKPVRPANSTTQSYDIADRLK